MALLSPGEYVADALAHGVSQERIDQFIAYNRNVDGTADYHRLWALYGDQSAVDGVGYSLDPTAPLSARSINGVVLTAAGTTQPALSSIGIASAGQATAAAASAGSGIMTVRGTGEVGFADVALPAGNGSATAGGSSTYNINAAGAGPNYGTLALIGAALVLFYLFGNKILR